MDEYQGGLSSCCFLCVSRLAIWRDPTGTVGRPSEQNVIIFIFIVCYFKMLGLCFCCCCCFVSPCACNGWRYMYWILAISNMFCYSQYTKWCSSCTWKVFMHRSCLCMFELSTPDHAMFFCAWYNVASAILLLVLLLCIRLVEYVCILYFILTSNGRPKVRILPRRRPISTVSLP